MSRSGGIPGNSSGNTSRYSQTIPISLKEVPWTLLSRLTCYAGIAALNATMVPSSLVNLMALLAHKMTPSYFLNQSIPRMISMPLESKTIRFARKSTTLMVILIAGHICFVVISPPGELTSMVCFMIVMGS
jgi:hypothetical protein